MGFGGRRRRPGPVYWFILTFGKRRWFSAIGSRIVFPLERWLWGRFGRSAVEASFHELLLTTTGRRSGKARPVPVLYLEHEKDYVVVGSNWGFAVHPTWSDNLLANPDARVRVAGSTWPVRARLATEAEKRELWPKLLDVYPAWETLRQRSGRDLRVFLLETAALMSRESGLRQSSG